MPPRRLFGRAFESGFTVCCRPFRLCPRFRSRRRPCPSPHNRNLCLRRGDPRATPFRPRRRTRQTGFPRSPPNKSPHVSGTGDDPIGAVSCTDQAVVAP